MENECPKRRHVNHSNDTALYPYWSTDEIRRILKREKQKIAKILAFNSVRFTQNDAETKQVKLIFEQKYNEIFNKLKFEGLGLFDDKLLKLDNVSLNFIDNDTKEKLIEKYDLIDFMLMSKQEKQELVENTKHKIAKKKYEAGKSNAILKSEINCEELNKIFNDKLALCDEENNIINNIANNIEFLYWNK